MPSATCWPIAALIGGLSLGLPQETGTQPSPPDPPTPPGAQTRSDTVDFSAAGTVDLRLLDARTS